MPIYEYIREDGTVFESIQKINDEPLQTCPTTGQKVKRLMSASAFHLKGSGWYKTDYASNGSSGGQKKKSTTGANGSSSSASSEGSSSSGGEAKSTAGACGTACGCH